MTFKINTTESMHSDKGFIALTTAIIISAALLIFVLAVAFGVYHSRFAIHESELKEKSAFLAEACFNTAILRIAQDSNYYVAPWDNVTVPVGDEFCSLISVQNGATSGHRVIKAQGRSGDAYTNLNVEILASALPNVEIMGASETSGFETGTIMIKKELINDDGGDAAIEDFTFRINGSPVSEGVAIEVPEGNHVLSEDPHLGYTQSDWGGSCAADGTISVVAGGNYTCTITNDDRDGSSSGPSNPSNPTLENSCGGLDIALLADHSGSIDRTEYAQMQSALSAFAGAFEGTETEFSLSQFSWRGSVRNPFSLSPAEAVAAINSMPQGSGATNWEDGLRVAYETFDPRPDKMNVIIIATDGEPNKYGNPEQGPSEGFHQPGLDAAVERANAIKAAGTRIIAIGIGAALPIERLTAITGPNVNTGDASADVITSGFATLAEDLSDLAVELCANE